jgi:methylmalonyl-CoA/ethylmalonyl-CoA epimerase
MIKYYTETVGLNISKEWHEASGNGVILEAGKASLELIDKSHAARIDEIEVGKRVAGPVRLAFNIGAHNIEKASEKWISGGATKLADIKQAPWSKVIRLEDPSGMQLTLFETSTLFNQ